MSSRAITGREVDGSVNSVRTGQDADPLVEIAAQFPMETARFLNVTMLVGGVVGFLVSVPCLAFVAWNWTTCAGCSRPLREWIVVHCIVHLVQSSIRLTLFYWLMWCGTGVTGERVQQVTTSPIWRVSKVLSLCTYMWLILGVVWLLNARSEPCPGIVKLCAFLLALNVVKMVVTFSMFRHTFVQQQSDQNEEPNEAPKGASEDLINLLPVFTCGCAPPADGGSETGCAVCLMEFEKNHRLRQLPCGHKFHSACIDKWLRTRKVCPLCMQDVESTLHGKKPPLHKKGV